jgi:hypothetical protein
MHWACEKITVSPSLPDDVLLEALLEKVCFALKFILSFH